MPATSALTSSGHPAQVDAGGAGGSFKMFGAAAFSVDDVGGAGTGEQAANTHLRIGNAPSGAVAASAAAGGGTGMFQVGANNNSQEQITISIAKTDATTLGTAALSLTNTTGAQSAIGTIDAAIKTVSTQRATLGAFQNRFEHTINNLNVAVENLSASESRIRDTDMAQEMVSFTGPRS